MSSPDFVVLGIPHEDGVMLLASNELSAAELEVEVDQVPYYRGANIGFLPGVKYITLTCHIGSYTIVTAPTYAEAFRNLFNAWTPKAPERRALSEGQRELPR
jgi:hypothetical protein